MRSVSCEADIREDDNDSSQPTLRAPCLGKNPQDCSREGSNCGEEAGGVRDAYNPHILVVPPGRYEM